SLGAVLYHMITGRRPFNRTDSLHALLTQILADDPPLPRSINPGVPRDLQTICLKCLEKDPARRYDGALALAADLGRYFGGQPIWGAPTPLWIKVRLWTQRHRAIVRVVMAAALLLAAVIATSVWGMWRERDLRFRADYGQRLEAKQRAE